MLRELYGVDMFREVAREMCIYETHDVGALALLCEQARCCWSMLVPMALFLPGHVVDQRGAPRVKRALAW